MSIRFQAAFRRMEMGFDNVASKKEGPVLNRFGATRELTSEQTCFVIWVIDMTITGIDEVCMVMYPLELESHPHSLRKAIQGGTA
jgi:hypothetical protein